MSIVKIISYQLEQFCVSVGVCRMFDIKEGAQHGQRLP